MELRRLHAREQENRTIIGAILLVAIVFSASPAWAGCMIYIVDYNENRYVWGPLTQECTAPRAPFGNWGVDSNHSLKYDGEQFRGWTNVEGHVEWNSCTDSPYDPPNCYYYNWSDCTEQYATGVRAYASWISDSLPWDCDVYGPIYTVSGTFMRLYELDDFFGGDDFVTELTYPTVNITVSPSCASGCSGDSGWMIPSSGNPYVATASVNVHVDIFPASP